MLSAARQGPLASRDFRLYAAGQLTSTIGDLCFAIALPWLILSTHGGPVLLGTVLACYGGPRTVLIPAGGVLADKIGPRTIMLAADVVRCAAVVVLAVLAARRTDSLAWIGLVAALLGAGEGVFLPASYTIIPAILEPGHLQAGNGLSSATVQLGSLAGPVLGGLLVTTWGPAPAFSVDAASFAVSATALALIRTRRSLAQARPVAAADSASALADPGNAAEPRLASAPPVAAAAAATHAGPGAATGVWALLRRSRLLQIVVAVCVAANFTSGGTFEVALPALAHAGFGAAGYGAIIACFGAGTIAGTLTAARSGQQRQLWLLACGCFVLASAALGLVPFLGGLPGAAAAIVVFGACNGFGNIVVFTLLQRWAPNQLLGRVMSLVMLASFGTFPASVAVSGILVRHLGPVPFFPVAGIVLGGAVLSALTQQAFRDFGAATADSAALGAEPA
jgi:MFS family permease